MYQFGDWQLRWLGHDSFQLTKNEMTIYIDPYQVESGRKADYIFITHEHYDHFDPASIQRIRDTTTVIIGPPSVTEQLDEMVVTLKPGDRHEFKDLPVQAIPAYNTNKNFHPQVDGKIGYILELDGQRLYHAGDTDFIPEMSQLGVIDLALLPVSGIYVMTAAEAVEAAKIIKPKVAIPMHYGSLVGTIEDAQFFSEALTNICQAIILEREPADTVPAGTSIQ